MPIASGGDSICSTHEGSDKVIHPIPPIRKRHTAMIGQAQGKVWVVDAPGYQPGPEATLVASTRTALGMQYRVLAGEQPHPAASSVIPGIEDGYLWLMRTGAGTSA